MKCNLLFPIDDPLHVTMNYVLSVPHSRWKSHQAAYRE